MCTVTFLTQENQIFITSNRDESPGRQAAGLTSLDGRGEHKLYFPLDETSGGSWIALNSSGRSVCLLNGAYESFVPKPSYRISRGEIVLMAASSHDTVTFLEQFDLDDIAPFTLLVYEQQTFMELVWDGAQRHIQSLPTDQPQIWSSATLYPPEVRAWRKSLFEQWLKETENINRDEILRFHQMANGDSKNDFIMNRNEIVKTLSVTNIQLTPETGSMLHLSSGPSLQRGNTAFL